VGFGQFSVPSSTAKLPQVRPEATRRKKERMNLLKSFTCCKRKHTVMSMCAAAHTTTMAAAAAPQKADASSRALSLSSPPWLAAYMPALRNYSRAQLQGSRTSTSTTNFNFVHGLCNCHTGGDTCANSQRMCLCRAICGIRVPTHDRLSTSNVTTVCRQVHNTLTRGVHLHACAERCALCEKKGIKCTCGLAAYAPV
jgi:hypothetical protein